MKRLLMLCTVMLGLIWGGAFASQAPQTLVEETANLMLSKLKEEKDVIAAQPNRIYELVDQIVIPHFDFEYMSQLVLAKYWRRATPKQRQAFTEEFKQLLVRTYATSLNEYTDQKLTYLPYRESSNREEALVKSEVDQPGGFPIPINYRLHEKGGEWKVFDVVIDGVSLVTNYRTSFANEIRSGDLDSLIKTLADRNKEAMTE
jgi:phospholipid transport system substrate-binding protein